MEHKNIIDPNIHEPKGVSTANENMVYIADGAGSGNWTYWPLGWGYYEDNASAQTITSTASKLSINGAGVNTETSWLPQEIRGSDELWDVSADKIEPIRLGDCYAVRVNLPVTAEAASPTELQLELDIGGGGTPTTVVLTDYIPTGRTTPYTISHTFTIPVYLSGMVTNGIQIFLHTDTGTLDITAPSITIVKITDGGF